MRCLAVGLLILLSRPVNAQISPPGLDDTNLAFWTAIGASQELSKKWSVTAYVGEARQSSPDNYRMMSKQAIFVVNQEAQYSFSKLWAASVCASFRVQSRYEHTAPYEAAEPSMKDEARAYSRVYYRPKAGTTQLSFSLRPEYRTFHYNREDWKPIDKEVRIRLKGQASIALDANKSNQLIIADEVLSATDHVVGNQQTLWTHMSYTENRLSTYHRHVFKHPSVIADLGVMQQFKIHGQYIAHVAVDFIFVNPFGSTKHEGP